MNNSRQHTFQQLRPPCIELSSVALKFKANQASAKAVLLALQKVHGTLESLGRENLLDERLAEYAFFPLTHIFNQSQQLSSRGLELAVRCVQILVLKGWRDRLVPEMAKQLLIMMGLLVSRNPKQQIEPASDELKVASFECMTALVRESASTTSDSFSSIGSKNIGDQLVYQLLEAVTDASSDHVQTSAAHALLELQRAIKDQVLLASLLPRTISTLVKVLRPSTQAKRTRKVLVAYLQLLTEALRKVLADEVLSPSVISASVTRSADAKGIEGGLVLDQSWLDATTAQIDLALVQVVKLKTSESPEVAEALLDLCLMVTSDCSQNLARSIPLMIGTMAALSHSSHDSRANSALKHLVASRSDMAEILSSKFYDWSQALPRVMQGNDDKPKQQLLKQVGTSFTVLVDISDVSSGATARVASVLVDSVVAAIGSSLKRTNVVSEAAHLASGKLLQQNKVLIEEFPPVVLEHQSQASSTHELKQLILTLKTAGFGQNITRCLVDRLHDPEHVTKVSATWLALQFLRSDASKAFDLTGCVADADGSTDLSYSRPFLISDLYFNTISFVTDRPDVNDEEGFDWRLIALSLESLVLQASQLRQSYRPELTETLFPLLTLLGSNGALLQRHATTALNHLALACEYESAAEMLIENVDYLINAVALRLNAFDVSRNGLQVTKMIIELCGTRILPHLDDLIGSIFGALDSFHGYPNLVEQLFEVLTMVVTESSKSPDLLAIEARQTAVTRNDKTPKISDMEDILSDLTARRERWNKSEHDHGLITSAPRRPWKTPEGNAASLEPLDSTEGSDDEDDQPRENTSKKEADLSKSHQLLLNIAQSTVPHISSPSPKVRLTLLELLRDICPLLGQHENSFLPLVNSIWPEVVSRLLDSHEGVAADAAYNVKAAAVTITAICRAAGDFVASRIEEVFPDVEAAFQKSYLIVASPTKDKKLVRLRSGDSDSTAGSLDSSMILRQEEVAPYTPSTISPYGDSVRTSQRQILEALIEMMVTILQSVRLSEDNADKILGLLEPLRHMTSVRDAMERYNEDAVWLMAKPQS